VTDGQRDAPRTGTPRTFTAHIAPGTIRAWLRADKIKPWLYHSWQRSTDPHFVDKASPVLDRYEHAQALAVQGEALVCSDEKTSSPPAGQRDAGRSARVPPPRGGSV
jgi:hypothetical protein